MKFVRVQIQKPAGLEVRLTAEQITYWALHSSVTRRTVDRDLASVEVDFLALEMCRFAPFVL